MLRNSHTGSIFELLLLINDADDVGHIYTRYYRGNRHFTDIKVIRIQKVNFSAFLFEIVSILVEWLRRRFKGIMFMPNSNLPFIGTHNHFSQ